jgi:hypothetical protein
VHGSISDRRISGCEIELAKAHGSQQVHADGANRPPDVGVKPSIALVMAAEASLHVLIDLDHLPVAKRGTHHHCDSGAAC